MGYTTDFSGSLRFDKPLTPQQADYINLLGNTRRMKRDVKKLMEIYKGEHGNPFATEKTPEAIYGHNGEFFAFDDGQSGQSRDESIVDYNVAPGQSSFLHSSGSGQPGLWCQWCVITDKTGNTLLQWDGGEKFYNYIEWLKYLISTFFEPWGCKLNGEIEWFGEDYSDRGKIVVKNNQVRTFDMVPDYRERDEDE